MSCPVYHNPQSSPSKEFVLRSRRPAPFRLGRFILSLRATLRFLLLPLAQNLLCKRLQHSHHHRHVVAALQQRAAQRSAAQSGTSQHTALPLIASPTRHAVFHRPAVPLRCTAPCRSRRCLAPGSGRTSPRISGAATCPRAAAPSQTPQPAAGRPHQHPFNAAAKPPGLPLTAANKLGNGMAEAWCLLTLRVRWLWRQRPSQ